MASKLIVNEIEHTDGSGTAVTMAKATIADATLTSATLPAAGITGTLGSGVIFPSGHIINSHSKQFYENISSNGGSVLEFASGNDCLIGTVEAGVTLIAFISGGACKTRENGTNSGTVAFVRIGPTSDLDTYLGGGGDSGGGSGADIDMYHAPFAIGARYFSSQTASVVVRGGCTGYDSSPNSSHRLGWKSYVWNPVTIYAFQILGDHGITQAT